MEIPISTGGGMWQVVISQGVDFSVCQGLTNTSEASFADLLLSHGDLLLSDQATFAHEAGRDDVALEGFKAAVTFFRDHRQGLPIHAALLLHPVPLQHLKAGQELRVRKATIAVRRTLWRVLSR